MRAITLTADDLALIRTCFDVGAGDAETEADLGFAPGTFDALAGALAAADADQPIMIDAVLLPALAGAIGVGAEMEIDGLTDAAYYRALAIAEAIDGPAPAVGFV